ncbi:MAG: hypothetical protein WAV29_00615 [Microgenomates group bacterium]
MKKMHKKHRLLREMLTNLIKSGKLSREDGELLKNELRDVIIASNSGRRTDLLNKIEAFSKSLLEIVAASN